MNRVILKGTMKDGMYPINQRQPSKSLVSFLAYKISNSLWHARLVGHPQSQTLSSLCLPSMNKIPEFCESHVLKKSIKLPFESR